MQRVLAWLGRRRRPGANRATDVETRIVGVKGTGESMPAATIVVRFQNLSGDSLEIEDYQIVWPGGRFTAALRDLRVAPRGQIERTARVEQRHGDIGQLLARPDRAKVQVLNARRSR